MVGKPSIVEFLAGVLLSNGPLLLPLWLVGLYRIFRRLNGVDYSFLGVMFVVTAAALFIRSTPIRMIVELFMPLLAAGAVFIEDSSTRIRWGGWIRTGAVVYLLLAGAYYSLTGLPILQIDGVRAVANILRPLHPPYQEFGVTFDIPSINLGKLGWEELVQEVAEVYDELPPEDRAIAGIYGDSYMIAGAIDELGPKYGLPHAVSGHLTYYLWGPGYTWDVMIIITQYPVTDFFYRCKLQKVIHHPYAYVGSQEVYVCRYPKVTAESIWSEMKIYR